MEQWIGIPVVAAVAAMIFLLSRVRRRRIQPFLDAFARAYCEAVDHAFGGVTPRGVPLTETVGGGFRLLPKERQPEGIRQLMERGVDGYVTERIRTMFDMRAKAQEQLSSINLIGDRLNGVMNRVYDLANLSFSVLREPGTVMSENGVKDLDFFLNQQDYIRDTTLSAVVSDTCRADIGLLPQKKLVKEKKI